jgi:hypothetical protein
VFSLRRESLKLILVDEPLLEVVLSQLRTREIQEGKQEAKRGHWFNGARPMSMLVKTWKVK